MLTKMKHWFVVTTTANPYTTKREKLSLVTSDNFLAEKPQLRELPLKMKQKIFLKIEKLTFC